MGTNRNINDTGLTKVTDFTNALNRLYSSKTDSTLDGYILTKELIDYILTQIPGGGDMLKSIYDTDNSGVVDNAELIDGDTVANDSAVQANTAKVSYDDSGNVVLLTGAQIIAGAKKFSSQATGGDNTKTFAAVASFNLNDGNSQEMIVSANITSLALTEKVNGGSYLIYLIQDGTGSWTIPVPGATFGNKTDNSADFVESADAVNIINVNVRSNGTTYYTIETYTP